VNLFCIAVLCAALTGRISAEAIPAESQQERLWIEAHLGTGGGSGGQLPFSFIYGGQTSAQLLSSWPKTITSKQLDPNRRQITITWTDPKTGLEVTCRAVEFSDYPALEWTVFLKNTGHADTPILEKIEAIDSTISAEKQVRPHLHYIDGDGDALGQLQFAPHDVELAPSAEMKFAPLNGRPTDGSFPCYNFDWQGRGAIVALGWPGQWSTSLVSDAQGDVHVTGGQETTHLVLHPGEEIRTPRIVLLFWERENWIDAQNLWRRWMRAHNMPRPGGQDIPVVRAGGGFLYDKLGWGGDLQNEKDQLALMDRYHEDGIKLNTWWIDILGAGTFRSISDEYNPTPQPAIVSWDTDRSRFPHGLREVSDRAHQLGAKLLVWIEPEHVNQANVLCRDHKDWLLSAPDDPAVRKQINQGVVLGNRQVVNLGNPAACQWLIDRLSRLIDEEGIDVYRQDFNITPLLFWHHNDTPDRQGMTENLYVQGYLRLLDTLLARHPNLLIDTCASGGRRDDLETLRRAVPLWRSDEWGPDVVLQDQTFGMAFWIPYFGTGTHATDPYAYCSSLGSSLFTSWDVRDSALNVADLKKLEAEFWQTAPFFREDYYPLTAYDSGQTAWVAWQFNRPEKQDGILQAFRRSQSGETTKTFQLHGLDATATYRVTDLDTNISRDISGGELMSQGLPVPIKDQPGAAVLIYRALNR
jgi:alpha-galactosidase